MNQTMSRIAGEVAYQLLPSTTAVPSRTDRHFGHHRVFTPDHEGQPHHIQVIYRGAVVAVVSPERVVLHSHGWRTLTTKSVMNAALAGALCNDGVVNVQVYQKNWEWYVFDNRNSSRDDRVFEDGMEVRR